MNRRSTNDILILNKDELNDSVTEHFMNEVYPKRVPVILRNFDIGCCVEKWNNEYLASQLGDQTVKVHVSTTEKMDFINKNFIYRSLPFSELIKRASESHHENYFLSETELYYLRSIGENPRKDVSDIHEQFPSIAEDIEFPACYPKGSFFSSVFRISSSKTCLWTHYDIMDNFLIQIIGSKRCVLFPPSDVLNLYLDGDKSKVLDIDNPDMDKFPNFKNVEWHECILHPGDILFIPALWFHNMTALDCSVAVNVFWKHLESSCYDKKDTYGNKDLLPATNSFVHVDKAIKCINELPLVYRKFYARRMIARIEEKILNME